MTNKEKKEYLGRYKPLDEQVNQLLLEKQEILALGTKVTPTYSDMPHGVVNNGKIPSVVERLEKQDAKINYTVDKLIDFKEDIERAIHTLQDETLRLLLRYRYINGWTWERIAIKMSYSYMQICRLHGRALELITL